MQQGSFAPGNVLIQAEVAEAPPSVRWDRPGTPEKCDMEASSSDSFLFISLSEVGINDARV